MSMRGHYTIAIEEHYWDKELSETYSSGTARIRRQDSVANGGDCIRHRAAGGSGAPKLRQGQHVGPIENGLEVGFVDDVLSSDLAGSQPSNADPAADCLGVAPCALRRFRNGQHVVGYYYIATTTVWPGSTSELPRLLNTGSPRSGTAPRDRRARRPGR